MGTVLLHLNQSKLYVVKSLSQYLKVFCGSHLVGLVLPKFSPTTHMKRKETRVLGEKIFKTAVIMIHIITYLFKL